MPQWHERPVTSSRERKEFSKDYLCELPTPSSPVEGATETKEKLKYSGLRKAELFGVPELRALGLNTGSATHSHFSPEQMHLLYNPQSSSSVEQDNFLAPSFKG